MECLCTHDVETEVQRHGQPGENLLQNDHLMNKNHEIDNKCSRYCTINHSNNKFVILNPTTQRMAIFG